MVSSCVALVIYIINASMNISIGLESSLLENYEKVLSLLQLSYHDSIPPEVMPINVAYDRQLVEVNDDLGIPCGNTDITDRSKLFWILKILNEAANYKYIILDVDISIKGNITNIDDSLFTLIENMKHILLPYPEQEGLPNEKISSKLAPSSYATSIWSDKCIKYPLFLNNQKTIALRMYDDLFNHQTSTFMGFIKDECSILTKSQPLVFPYRIRGAYKEDGIKNYYNLGADLMANDSPALIRDLAQNKIVMIGDFIERDMHDTFLKPQPGVLIHYNAYRTLVEKRASISLGFIFLLWLLCVIITLFQLKKKSFSNIISHFIRIKSSFWIYVSEGINYTLLFSSICILGYVIYDRIYEVLIFSLFFPIQKLIIDNYASNKT